MKRTVLVVDADRETCDELVLLLQVCGYEAYGVVSFAAAKAALREIRPHLIITDHRLGEHNGLHLIILANALGLDAGSIVMSAHDAAFVEAQAKRLGAEFVRKPIDLEKLIDLVQNVLAAHRR